jgi:ABC-type branched-subunit amino acid transport system ATPase component
MDRGKLIAEGDPAAIRANRLVQAVYLGEEG